MDFKDFNWTLEDCQKYEEYLKNISEGKYRDFSKNITPTKYEILGVRVPTMRKIAKEIYKSNYKEYLKITKWNYYEEIFIEGIVISQIKDVNELIKYMNLFVKQIDNWAICDSFCNSLKIINENKEKFLEVIINYLNSKKEFVVRVGLILILNYYIEDKYIDKILLLVSELKSDKYYINMAIAWLLCECFIKQKDKTLNFLENNNLSAFVQNKTISKIKDSYRVTKEEKQYLNTLKK
jgi:3-methyladenine DNA glycosylase AlkD